MKQFPYPAKNEESTFQYARKPSVRLTCFKHKGQQCIGIHFPYDDEIRNVVCQIPGVHYSQSHRTFYCGFSKEKFDEIVARLKSERRYPDFRNFWNSYYQQLNKEKADQQEKSESPALSEKQLRACQEFRNYLIQKRYSPRTVKTYYGGLVVFFRWMHKEIEDIQLEDITRFNLEYIIRKGYSFSYQNQVINAIKLFYEKQQSRKLDIDLIERPRRGFHLPKVIEKHEVERLLRSIKNPKHRLALTLVYALGLRSGELLNIKLEDVRSKDKLITIRGGKGDRDRTLPLSENLLEKMRAYYRLYKPQYYLIEGDRPREPYSARSLSNVFRHHADELWGRNHFSLHCLRHSFATHNLEAGVDLRYIQELLGHKSSKTTEIYTYVSIRSLRSIKILTDDFDI